MRVIFLKLILSHYENIIYHKSRDNTDLCEYWMYNVINRSKVHDATYLKCRKSNSETCSTYISVRTQSNLSFVCKLTADWEVSD